MMGPIRPEWSGVARGCSHPHKNKDRVQMHTIDRQAEQLAMAGVGLGGGKVGGRSSPPDLSWVEQVQRGAARTELTWFGVRKPFALLVPGASPHRPEKRWPAERFGDFAMRLRRAGIMPVILGTDSEKDDAYIIQQVCPGAMNLVNRTDLSQIVMLAKQAALAVGNDTGPMHLISSANCPSVVLFSDASDPERCAPRGKDVTIIQKESLPELSVGELWEALITTGKLELTLAPFKRGN
jgi:ADP-heptose:LPS heptosyltransferase